MSLMYHDTVIAGTPVIDNTPTAGSNHAVSSGGVKSALNNAESLIAPVETGATASRQYLTGQIFIKDETIYRAKTDISQGDQFSVGTNIEAKSISDIFAYLTAVVGQALDGSIMLGRLVSSSGYGYLNVSDTGVRINGGISGIALDQVPYVDSGNKVRNLALKSLSISGASAGAPVVVKFVDNDGEPTAYEVGHPLTTHESWTFTLANGTTVTKDVVLW